MAFRKTDNVIPAAIEMDTFSGIGKLSGNYDKNTHISDKSNKIFSNYKDQIRFLVTYLQRLASICIVKFYKLY